ncbi:MAG: hypothetical protein R3F61_05900 [Myxococcota bacterium]
MNAPEPRPVVLAVDRTRCACQTETLVFAPRAWYPGQAVVAIEPACVGCGKSLLEQVVPEGAKWEAYALASVPADLAAAIGSELADEVVAARTEPVTDPPGGLSVARWSVPHEASAEYVAWLAAQPGRPARVSPEELREWALPAVLVAIWVVVCVVA